MINNTLNYDSIIKKLNELKTFNYQASHLCLICQTHQAIASHTISQKNLMNFLFLNQKKGCILYQKHNELSTLILKLKNEKKEGAIKEKQQHYKTNVRVASTVPAFCPQCESLFTLTDNPHWLNKERQNYDEALIFELVLKSLAWEIKQIEKHLDNNTWLIKTKNFFSIFSLKPLKEKEQKELNKNLYYLKEELIHLLELKQNHQLLEHFNVSIKPIESKHIGLNMIFQDKSVKEVKAILATTKTSFEIVIHHKIKLLTSLSHYTTLIDNRYYAKPID